uniref:PAS domain-containing protein n=1 Tax=Chrysotila carterae TaxID=13221 RepID=A0A7S4BGS9_CHRCT
MDKIRTTVQNLRRQIRSLRDTVSAEHAGQDQACMRNEWEALRRQLHCALQDTYQPSEQLNRDQAGPDQLIQQDNPTRSPLPRHRWKPLPAADVVPDPPPPTSANAVPMDKRSPPTVRPKSSVYTPRRSPAKTSQTRRSPARIIDPLPRSSPRRAASFYVKPEDKPQAMPAQLSPQSARPSTAAAKQSPVRGDGSASARPTTSEKAQSSASEQRPLSEFWNRRSVDARQSAQASSSPRSSPPNLHRATTFQPSNFQLPSKYTGTGRSFSPEQQERSSSSSKPLPEVTSPTATSVPKPQLLRRQALTPLTTPSESLTSAASSAKQPDSPNEGKASALPRVKDSRSATRVDADNTRIGNDADSKMGKCKPSLTNLAKLAGVQWSCNDTRSWLEKFTEVCDYFQSGIVVVDIHAAGLPICWANEAFKTLIGYTSKAAVGRNCQFLEGSATEMHIVQDIARRMREPNKDSKPMRITNHTQAGKAFKYTLSLHPIWDPEGAQVFCVGVICPSSGKCELVEEIRRLMPTLCDKHPTAHTTTLSAFDKEAAARMLNRCRAIFKLDYDAGLSALFSLQETRAMLEAFVLDRSEPERFDLEISRVTENFQHRLYVAKEERLRAKDFKVLIYDYSDSASRWHSWFRVND